MLIACDSKWKGKYFDIHFQSASKNHTLYTTSHQIAGRGIWIYYPTPCLLLTIYLYTVARPIATKSPCHGCMGELTLGRNFDSQATWVIDVLGFFSCYPWVCLHNQALADVRSTGAGIKCLYCRCRWRRCRDMKAANGPLCLSSDHVAHPSMRIKNTLVAMLNV